MNYLKCFYYSSSYFNSSSSLKLDLDLTQINAHWAPLYYLQEHLCLFYQSLIESQSWKQSSPIDLSLWVFSLGHPCEILFVCRFQFLTWPHWKFIHGLPRSFVSIFSMVQTLMESHCFIVYRFGLRYSIEITHHISKDYLSCDLLSSCCSVTWYCLSSK